MGTVRKESGVIRVAQNFLIDGPCVAADGIRVVLLTHLDKLVALLLKQIEGKAGVGK